MKIAIPSRAGVVDEHFGHCEAFTIYTVDANKDVTDKEMYTPTAECGCKSDLVPILVNMGVKELIAGNMGQGAVAKLQRAGIRVYRGNEGPVEDAIKAWKAGDLEDKQEVCADHDDHECHHEHDHSHLKAL